MKTILSLILASLFSSAWAIDINLKLVQPKKKIIVSKMICEKNSCICPEDTILNTETMNCNKCPEGFVSNNNGACIDPNFQAEGRAENIRLVKPESLLAITNTEGSSPLTCDMRTFENGKFKSCTCENKAFTIDTKSKKKLLITVQTAFKPETQKCEVTSDSVVVTIPNLSCYGPKEGVFDDLAKEGLINVKYNDPGMSLGSCGVTDGEHSITFKKPELMASILDALMFTLNPNIFEAKVESFEIDLGSINY